MKPLVNSDWNNFLELFPNHHLLQTSQWAEVKYKSGWNVKWVIDQADNMQIGAQLLFKRIFPGINMAYIPKGPVYDFTKQAYPPEWFTFWQQVDQICQENSAFMLKVEPDFWIKSESLAEDSLSDVSGDAITQIIPEAKNPPNGFISSSQSIQPMRSLVIDIRSGEDVILSRMKQKTRYNIKLALKRGVIVKTSNDIESFSKIMNVTGNRDGFGVHDHQYYKSVYQIFNPRNECQLLTAEYQGETLASIMVFTQGKRAWYLYGASSNEKRELMPTYILQWEAIRWARKRGCIEYDLWGVPDADLTQLEENFTQRNDNLWGVYRFKRGFGGELKQAAGPWDRVYKPTLYKLYRYGLRLRNPSLF